MYGGMYVCMQVTIDYSELEEQFAVKNPGKSNTAATSSPAGTGPTAQATAEPVLDIDRARNVGVLMRSLKMSAKDIEAALHATLLNDGSGQRHLEEFEVDGILAAFPTVEEGRMLQNMGCAPFRSSCVPHSRAMLSIATFVL
jgi:hypothetical protein